MTTSIRRWALSTLTVLTCCGIAAAVRAAPTRADSTGDFPIPRRIWQTPCDAEQVLAAVRDTSPVCFQRYMIDKSHRPADVQQAAVDRINWFFDQSPTDRRAYSEEVATNINGEPMAQHWGNWAKVFFNNKGVASSSTPLVLGADSYFCLRRRNAVPPGALRLQNNRCAASVAVHKLESFDVSLQH
jgi:Domain of unknown function (DUF5078)